MSSKLTKRPFVNAEQQAAKQHTTIVVPVPPGTIQQFVLVIRKQNGVVEVAGPVHETEMCLTLMKQGMVRVVEWAERQKAASAIEVHQTMPPGLAGPGERTGTA